MATTYFSRQHDFDDAINALEHTLSEEDYGTLEEVLDRMSVDVCTGFPYYIDEWEIASKPAKANLAQLERLDACRETLIKADRNDLRDILDELIDTLLEPEAEWVNQLKQQVVLDRALEALMEASDAEACNQALVEIAFLTTAIHTVRPAALLTVENAGNVIDKAYQFSYSENSLSTVLTNNASNGFLEDYCEVHRGDLDALAVILGEFDDD